MIKEIDYIKEYLNNHMIYAIISANGDFKIMTIEFYAIIIKNNKPAIYGYDIDNKNLIKSHLWFTSYQLANINLKFTRAKNKIVKNHNMDLANIISFIGKKIYRIKYKNNIYSNGATVKIKNIAITHDNCYINIKPKQNNNGIIFDDKSTKYFLESIK